MTFLMVEINYSQVRIEVDTRSKGDGAVATVGGSINSPPPQQTNTEPQSCSGSIYRNGSLKKKTFKKKQGWKDLINETVTTVMFVGIKGGWEV